jgi:hypothetical protein
MPSPSTTPHLICNYCQSRYENYWDTTSICSKCWGHSYELVIPKSYFPIQQPSNSRQPILQHIHSVLSDELNLHPVLASPADIYFNIGKQAYHLQEQKNIGFNLCLCSYGGKNYFSISHITALRTIRLLVDESNALLPT